MMTTATETMATIRDHGKKVADASLKVVGSLAPGDFVAQGDVMLWRLKKLPVGCLPVDRPETQLAPGTTKGSRHCVRQTDMSHCKFYRLKDSNALQGPIIKADKPFLVEHPEHGDQQLPEGIWAVTYQRAHADELRRVAD